MANQPVDHEKLLAFIDGTLDPEESRELNERMEQDADLRRQVSELIENRRAPTPPPFPGAEPQPPPPAVEPPQKPLARFLASLKGQSREQSRLAAFAIGSLLAAAVSGMAFLLYLDGQIKESISSGENGSTATVEATPPAPPADAVAADAGANAGTAQGSAGTTGDPAPEVAAPTDTASPPPADAMAAPSASQEAPPTSAASEPAAPVEAPAAAAPSEPEPATGAPQVETAAPTAAPPAAPSKVSAPADGGRFAVLAKACSVHEQPDTNSKTVNQLNEGQRLWTEPAIDGWKKVYRKKGVAYVQDECFAAP